MKLYYSSKNVSGVLLFETNEFIKLDKYKTVKNCIKHAKVTNSKGEVLRIPEDVETVDVEKVWSIKKNIKTATHADFQYLLFSVLSQSERLRQAYCPVILTMMLSDMVSEVKVSLDSKGEYKHLTKKFVNSITNQTEVAHRKIASVLPKELLNDLIEVKKDLQSYLHTNLFMLKIQLKNEALKVAPDFRFNDEVIACEIIRLFCMFIIGQDEVFDNLVGSRLGIKYACKDNEEISRIKKSVGELMEHLVKPLNVCYRFDGQTVGGINPLQLSFDSLIKKINTLKWTELIR